MKDKVLIWTVAVGMGSFTIPDDLLENLDGLVLSGMGTGTLPDSYIEHLSPRWTTRIPIVIVSRCTVGCGYDDFYYRGSKDKYVRRGFVLDDGFEELNPVQARAKLILELTWKKWKKASEVTRQPEEGQSKSTTTSSRDGARE
jgi:L-asparaginase